MTSAAPARKPYRKAPPQHRETRHALPAAPPPPAQQLDVTQVNQHTTNTPATSLQHLSTPREQAQSMVKHLSSQTEPLSDSELDVSSLSSLELCIPPPPLFSSHVHRPDPTAASACQSLNQRLTSRKHSQGSRGQRQTPANRTQADGTCSLTPPLLQRSAPPKGILKPSPSRCTEHSYDVIRKAKSVEIFDSSSGRSTHHSATHSLDRAEQRASSSQRSSAPPSTHKTPWNWRMQVLEEKIRFSHFLDEITCRVLSPAHLMLLGREQSSTGPRRRSSDPQQLKADGTSAERRRRWDDWVAALQRYQPLKDKTAGQETPKTRRTEGARHVKDTFRLSKGIKMEESEEPLRCKHRLPVSNQSIVSHIKVGRDEILVLLSTPFIRLVSTLFGQLFSILPFSLLLRLKIVMLQCRPVVRHVTECQWIVTL